MGYTLATITALAEMGAEIHLVHWDHIKLTPFTFSAGKNIHIYSRSELNARDLEALAKRLQPDITVVSGWLDKDYLKVARMLKALGGKVVMTIDNQWNGTLRQHAGTLASRLGHLSRSFSHAWVPGPPQYELVRRLGFVRENIIFDLYSADVALFESSYVGAQQNRKKTAYPHQFLFVGRLEPVKGLDILIEAWESIKQTRGEWGVTLIGNGSLKDILAKVDGFTVADFMQPEKLVKFARSAGCFILPSRGEPWGVVVHEFAAAGLPLILSDAVGARSAFLIPGLNGEVFANGSSTSLAVQMTNVIAQSDDSLIEMGRQSNCLAQRITPMTSAANLLSLK